DAEILKHERLRRIDVKVFELRAKLEDEGVSICSCYICCDHLRKKLQSNVSQTSTKETKGLKSHQGHEIARTKSEESERLPRAFGIPRDYGEGQHWRTQQRQDLR
ncbi:hypothetical protein K470DRAFT_223893, partial [Piedraia hortae CBS 480.64]